VAIEILDRDLELYHAYGRGARKVDLAKRYDVDRDTVTAIIDRVKATMPPVDRAQVFDQSVEILDQGLDVFVPMMLDGDKAAGRLVDRYLGRRNEMLGLDSPAKLELSAAKNEIKHQPIDVKAELAVLLAEIRKEQGHGP
jgi:hypothetical protein